MIIEIELFSRGRSTNLKVDSKNSKAILNGKKIELNIEDFSARLVKIVKSWKEKMVNYDILDGLSYTVKITYDDKTERKYEGQNEFPENFNEFNKLLMENDIISLNK